MESLYGAEWARTAAIRGKYVDARRTPMARPNAGPAERVRLSVLVQVGIELRVADRVKSGYQHEFAGNATSAE
jgi:hypothetical protein